METIQKNKAKPKNLNYKHVILALFQFFSLVGIIFLLFGYALISQKVDPQNISEWLEKIKNAFLFSTNSIKSIGIFGSLFIYISLFLWIIANFCGLLITRFKNRNLFDQLFLIFMLIPVISNVFGLFSQLANKKFEYTSSSFDKAKIIRDQTKTAEINIRKAEKEELSRIKKTKVHPEIEKSLKKKGLLNKDSKEKI